MRAAAWIACLFFLLVSGVPAHAQTHPAALERLGLQMLQELQDRANEPSQKRTSVLSAASHRAELAEIQSLLNQLGYEAGTVDGRMGPKTRYAIQAFQSHSGMRVTGRQEAGLLQALQRAVEERSAPALAQTEQLASTAGSAVFEILHDVDLPYSDFRSGMEEAGLRGINVGQCQAECERDGRCRSFTFNVKARVCFLKHSVPQRTSFHGAISGIRQIAPPVSPSKSGPTVIAENDRPGSPAPLNSEVEDASAAPGAAVDWIDDLLSPEGLSVGMAAEEAKSVLTGRGYTQGKLGCVFRAPGADQNRGVQISFQTEPLLPQSGAPGPSLAEGCPTDGMIVAQLSIRDRWGPSSKVDAIAAIEALTGELGAHAGCSILAPYEARWCVWRSLPADAKVSQLTISINSNYREAVLEADRTAIRPEDPGRTRIAEVNAAGAASICQNYRPDHVFHDIRDCSCIVDEIRRASLVGLVNEVTVQTVDSYARSCPASLERLATHFEGECIRTIGSLHSDPAAKTWALNGGCSCVGTQSAQAFIADPNQNPTGINSLGQCGYSEREQIAAAIPPADAAEAGNSTMASVAGDLRPVDLWLKDGRPVLHHNWQPLTPEDYAFDYEAQEAAVRRWIDLVMIAEDPSLADQDGALEVLAAENLSQADHQRLLTGCGFDHVTVPYCKWRAENEFERRRLQREFSEGYLQKLEDLGKTMPRELTFAGGAHLGEYDHGRGGFPVTVFEEASWPLFTITDASIFGFAGLIQGIREAPQREVFWPVPEQEAEATLAEVENRYVQLAWSYRIQSIRKPEEQYSSAHRAVVLELLGAALYADARLTTQLHELTRETEDIAEAMTPPAGAPPADAVVLTNQVPELPLHEGAPTILVDPYSSDPEIMRYFDLLVIGQRPELARDPANALKLASSFFAGLADPNGSLDWAGNNEFERGRNAAAFKASGPELVIAMAPDLPQTIVLVQPAHFGEYDFGAQAFPITYYGNWQPGGAEVLTLSRYSNDSVAGVVQLRLHGPQIPASWAIHEDKAQVVLEEFFPDITDPYHRRLHVVSRIELTESGSEDRPTFSGTLKSIALYADPELTKKIADFEAIPATTLEKGNPLLDPDKAIYGSCPVYDLVVVSPHDAEVLLKGKSLKVGTPQIGSWDRSYARLSEIFPDIHFVQAIIPVSELPIALQRDVIDVTAASCDEIITKPETFFSTFEGLNVWVLSREGELRPTSLAEYQ